MNNNGPMFNMGEQDPMYYHSNMDQVFKETRERREQQEEAERVFFRSAVKSAIAGAAVNAFINRFVRRGS